MRRGYVLGGRHIPMVIGGVFSARAAISDFIDAPSGMDAIDDAIAVASAAGTASDRWLVVDRATRSIVAARDAADVQTPEPTR